MMKFSKPIVSTKDYDLVVYRKSLFGERVFGVIHRENQVVAGNSVQYPEAYRALHMIQVLHDKVIEKPLPDGFENTTDGLAPPVLQ